jgi:hypothetical protein
LGERRRLLECKLRRRAAAEPKRPYEVRTGDPRDAAGLRHHRSELYCIQQVAFRRLLGSHGASACRIATGDGCCSVHPFPTGPGGHSHGYRQAGEDGAGACAPTGVARARAGDGPYRSRSGAFLRGTDGPARWRDERASMRTRPAEEKLGCVTPDTSRNCGFRSGCSTGPT